MNTFSSIIYDDRPDEEGKVWVNIGNNTSVQLKVVKGCVSVPVGNGWEVSVRVES